MTPWQVKFYYCLIYAGALAVGGSFAALCDKNYFGEIGATIIIYAVWRGTRTLRSSGITAFNELEKNAALKIIRWDIIGGIIGTAVNGFSSQIFWLFQQF